MCPIFLFFDSAVSVSLTLCEPRQPPPFSFLRLHLFSARTTRATPQTPPSASSSPPPLGHSLMSQPIPNEAIVARALHMSFPHYCKAL
ncbi:hypothetical protein QJS04_geneDACA007633 [Acorus gramineus]|uniref:Secreted protein n=1 Tax=Acorus gramineus TaxID=55184 RepID=A0AAV9B705_ACOGR|nr:hypothetical protein QJS04_geneDACA007633 [Acorus gramineus]